MKLIALVMLAAACQPCLTASAAEPAPTKLPAKKDFHLFILAGQSNMAGRGKVTATDRQPHARVLSFNKQGKWVPAVDPLHWDKASAGVGLGRTFANTLVEAKPEITVGLIPCAAGGSPISSWQPGGYHGQTKSHPLDDCLRRAKLAMPHGTLKAILWHQGESDSNPAAAAVYEQKLHELIQLMRKELDAPNLPFIVGQLGQFKERPWNDARRTVNAAHSNLPEKVDFTAFVKSDGLTHKGDQVHFSAESYREFGKRYAEAYSKLVNEQP